MQNSLKKLIASTLACGILLSANASAVNPETMKGLTEIFGGRAILDESEHKFPMADAEQILEKMISLFKGHPGIANKLVSHKPLVITPFDVLSPRIPEDSTELFSGTFIYKAARDANYLFIDMPSVHLCLAPSLPLIDPLFGYNHQQLYDDFFTSELVSLLIHVIIHDRHISKCETQGQAVYDSHFDKIKEEIISLARTKYRYVGKGELLKGRQISVLGETFSDSTISSKKWLVGLFSDVLTGKDIFDDTLRAAANDWLQKQ